MSGAISHCATSASSAYILPTSSGSMPVEHTAPNSSDGNELSSFSSSNSSIMFALKNPLTRAPSCSHIETRVYPDGSLVIAGGSSSVGVSKSLRGTPPRGVKLSEDIHAKKPAALSSGRSVELVEFASLLQPNRNDFYKEQILHMLNAINDEEALFEISRVVEEKAGAARQVDLRKGKATTMPSPNAPPSSLLPDLSTSFGSRDRRWASHAAKALQKALPVGEGASFGAHSQAPGGMAKMKTPFVRRKSCTDAVALGLSHFITGKDNVENADTSGLNGSPTSSSQTTMESASKDMPALADEEVQRILDAVIKAGRRVAISAPVCDIDQSSSCEATKIDTKCREKALRLVSFINKFTIFTELGEKQMKEVALALKRETRPSGATIMMQGMQFDGKLYLLYKGKCEVIKNDKIVKTVTCGADFGNFELMCNQAKCAMTVRCLTPCVLYTLDREVYHHAVVNSRLSLRKRFKNIILKVPLLSVLSEDERLSVIDVLTIKVFKKGQHIFHFGQKTFHMYLMLEGEAKVMERRRGHKSEVMRLYKDDVIGEIEFIFGHPTVADVIVTSKRVVTASISRGHFELIAGPIHENLKKLAAMNPVYARYSRGIEKAPLSVQEMLDPVVAHTKTEPAMAPRAFEASSADVDPSGELVMPLRFWHHSPPPNPTPAHSNAGKGRGNTQQMGSPSDMILRFPIAPLFSASNMIFMGLGEDGTVCSWSDVLEKLTNYTSSEMIGHSIYSFIFEKNDQEFMRSSISKAVSCTGNIKDYLEQVGNTKPKSCRFVRKDGLTNLVLKLNFLPPLVACGNKKMNVVLAYGEQVRWASELVQCEPLLLFSEFRNILSNPTLSHEERQQLLLRSLENFEEAYRAATLFAEKLQVVNLQQIIGKIVMDFGSNCVTRGIMIRQHFNELPTMQVYLDPVLLPKCLHHAVSFCINVIHTKKLKIEVSLTNKDGLEFLVIDFNVEGPGFPPECIDTLNKTFPQAYSNHLVHITSHKPVDGDNRDDHHDRRMSVNAHIDGAISPSAGQGVDKEWERLGWVQVAMEEQGGTMRMVSSLGNSNLLFLIPFIPSGTLSKSNDSTNAASTLDVSESDNSSKLNIPEPVPVLAHGDSLASIDNLNNPLTAEDTPSLTPHRIDPDSSSFPNEELGEMEAKTHNAYAYMMSKSTEDMCAPKGCCYTTLVVEDNPVYRNMLCAYLWQRKHAVLSAQNIEDIERLSCVVDILFIDLSQSVLGSLGPRAAIMMLRGKMTQMAVVLTAEELTLASSEAFHAAGFINLKKPCTPAQAMQVISIAEEKMFVVKQEAEWIAHIREELGKGSHLKWKLGRLIGKGAFSEVYEVTDTLTGGRMAMKEIQLNCDKALVENSFHEIATMCNLQHPNIIHYFHCEESPDRRTIRVFMEYATGGTLRELLKDRQSPLEFSQTQRLLHDITAGLAYIHSQCYVHSDIKTANILLAQDGTGKIGDFGSAQQISQGRLLYSMQGSPLYMSPECMSAGDISPETSECIGYSFPTDIWSLGCVALELATNKPPFSHIEEVRSPAGLTQYITSLSDTPDLSPLFEFPPCLTEFVSACLNPQPEHRATAQELLQLSIFTESVNESTNSAILALQRAHLLHVLNKFVAFQDPPETPPQTASKALPEKRDSSRSKSSSSMRSPLSLAPKGETLLGTPKVAKETQQGKHKAHQKSRSNAKKCLRSSRSNEICKEDSVVASSPRLRPSETAGNSSDRTEAQSRSPEVRIFAKEAGKHSKEVVDSEMDFFSTSSSSVVLASTSPAVSISHPEPSTTDVDAAQEPFSLKPRLPNFLPSFSARSPLSSKVVKGTFGEPPHSPCSPVSKLECSTSVQEKMESEGRWRRNLNRVKKIYTYSSRVPEVLQAAANDVLSNIMRRRVAVGNASSCGTVSLENSTSLRSRPDMHSDIAAQSDHLSQSTRSKRYQLAEKLHDAGKVILNRSFFGVEAEGKADE